MSEKPEFWDSMTRSQTIASTARESRDWLLVRQSYEAWSPETETSRPIPRIIHQIWLGSPLPKLYARWGETWKKCHPGWEYRLWTEKEIAAFGLKNKQSFEQSPNFGVKSDLARYEILERFGGVYADTDFECLGSFEPLVRSTGFFAGLMYGDAPPTNNGLIGSVPGHPILKDAISRLSRPFAGHDGMDILAYSGPVMFNRVCLDHLALDPSTATLLPTTYFYAFPNQNLDLKKLKTVRAWAQPESLALHYWEVSWRKQSWTSRVYWWFKARLPLSWTRAVYRLLKGRQPDE